MPTKQEIWLSSSHVCSSINWMCWTHPKKKFDHPSSSTWSLISWPFVLFFKILWSLNCWCIYYASFLSNVFKILSFPSSMMLTTLVTCISHSTTLFNTKIVMHIIFHYICCSEIKLLAYLPLIYHFHWGTCNAISQICCPKLLNHNLIIYITE